MMIVDFGFLIEEEYVGETPTLLELAVRVAVDVDAVEFAGFGVGFEGEFEVEREREFGEAGFEGPEFEVFDGGMFGAFPGRAGAGVAGGGTGEQCRLNQARQQRPVSGFIASQFVHVGNDVAVGIHRAQAACGDGFLRGPQFLVQGFRTGVG
jgi:hypothetical protein